MIDNNWLLTDNEEEYIKMLRKNISDGSSQMMESLSLELNECIKLAEYIIKAKKVLLEKNVACMKSMLDMVMKEQGVGQ